MKWEVKALAEVASIGSGAGFPMAEQGKSTGDFPFLKVSDMNLPGNARTIERWNNMVTDPVRDRLRATAFPPGSVIFPKIGAAIGTNKKRLLTRACCIDNNVMAVVPDMGRLEPEYLYFLFLKKNISDFASDSNPPSIRKSTVENWQVEVPPLVEQRRIADLLARAQSVVRLCRLAQQKAAALIPAIFVDMFGDPATNPQDWPEKPVEALCTVATGATPKRDVRPYYEGGIIPWVKTGEVNAGEILQAEECITELAVSETNCKVFPAGTILIAMYGQGQTRGRAGLLKIPAATNQACAAILPSERVNQTFLFEMLRMQYERLRAMGRGGNQANLNLGMIKTLCVPMPPLDAQRAFARHAEALKSIQSQQGLALQKATAILDALLARSFAADGNAAAIHEAEEATS